MRWMTDRARDARSWKPESMTVTAPVPVSAQHRIRYGGLITIMLMGFLLVTAEFIPNGVLTEMAASLSVTPGQAGQTVTITAFVGLLVAPTVGLIFPNLDRRSLLIWMAIAAAASNLLVAAAPTLPLVLAARLLLGAAISAYWSMSITVAATLAGPARLGRGVMFTSAGVSLATVAGVPLGVMLAEAVDWRFVFILTGVLMLVLAVVLRFSLPPVPAADVSSLRVLGETIRRPGFGLGLGGHTAVVLGHFLAFTYVRLALERIEWVDAATIIVLLALFGLGGLAGNLVIGMVIDRRFVLLSTIVPIVIALAVAGMIALAGSIIAIGAVVVLWGFLFSSWLLVVNTWVGKRLPDRLEAGGSLVVVGFQLAITLAAGFGGLLVDTVGIESVYGIAVAILIAGGILFALANRRVRA